MVMKRYCLTAAALVLALLCLCPAQVAAGDRPLGSALQFSVGGSFSLGAFNGTTVAYRRSLSPDVDWRLGATIDLSYSSGEQTASGTGSNPGEDSAPVEEWYSIVNLRCEWIAYRGSGVSFYAGGGPQLRVKHSQNVGTSFYFSENNENEARHSRSRDAEYGIGLGGIVGVQWAPVEWCALHVEYRAAVGYTRGVYRDYSDREGGNSEYTLHAEEIVNSFEFDSQGVTAGLSIYF